MTASAVQFIVTQANVPIQPLRPTPIFTDSSPRAIAVINGKEYVPVEVEVNGNAHGATGDATITLPIGGNPDFSTELQRGTVPLGNGFTTTDNSPVYVQIYAGFTNGPVRGVADLVPRERVFFGSVDMYSAAFHGNAVTFTCRSLAAPLVDNEITRATLNETSLQFAQAAADVAGLKLVTKLGVRPITLQEVFAAQFVGGYNFAAAIYKRKWWNLLLSCAMFDDADVWVDDDTLYYAAPSLIQRDNVGLKYGRDVEVQDGLTGTHSVQFSKNIQIELHTYQRKYRRVTSSKVSTNPLGGYTAQTYTRKVTATPIFGTPDIMETSVSDNGTVTVSSSSSSGGAFNSKTGEGTETGKMRYVEFVRNVDPSRLNQLAQSLWRQISEYTYQIEMSVPVRPNNLGSLNKMTTLLDVSGVPYQNFDAKYYPRTRTLRINNEEGAGWRFMAVNHDLPAAAV